MAKKRYVNTRFWDDTYISNLDPSEKLLFLYFLTNPVTNISGIYEIPLKRIALDTGFDIEMIKKMMSRFIRDKKIVYEQGWLVLLNFIKHQNINSPAVQKGIENELKNSPNFLRRYIDRIQAVVHLNLNLNLDLDSNLNLDLDTKKETVSKRKRFTPPTISEIKEYNKLKGYSFDIEYFIDYYNSKGWMVGKNKMKSWKSAVNNWARNQKKYKEKNSGKNPIYEDLN